MGIKARVATVVTAAALAVASPVVMYFEGKKNQAYLDAVRIPTICYGHTSTAKIGQVKTDAECEELLKKDMAGALNDVDRLVKVPITIETRAALVSFVFNVGGTQFAKSTMLRNLNSGDYMGACKELDRWVYAGGVRLNGLVSRRKAERELCEAGVVK